MNIADEFNDTYDEQIKKYHKWLAGAKEIQARVNRNLSQYLPAKLASYDEATIWWSGTGYSDADLYIIIPWNPQLADEIALLLETFGWYQQGDWKREYAGEKPDYYMYYRHNAIPNMKVNLKMVSDNEKSTCRLVQVGTDVVEKPIWEVKCADNVENL